LIFFLPNHVLPSVLDSVINFRIPLAVPIPDHPGSDQHSISFGQLKIAQALGDMQALLNAYRNASPQNY